MTNLPPDPEPVLPADAWRALVDVLAEHRDLTAIGVQLVGAYGGGPLSHISVDVADRADLTRWAEVVGGRVTDEVWEGGTWSEVSGGLLGGVIVDLSTAAVDIEDGPAAGHRGPEGSPR